MLRIRKKWTLIASFFVHIIFLVSIFDIYFKSPLVSEVKPHFNTIPAKAKRLILFVGDGLRADSFFEVYNGNKVAAPYLRQIIEQRGRWGVSHTTVPTESRPGHVAMIAGFYEDPSAIFKGWKDNPVEFDSVFNRSSLTLGWGSPDILLMFNKDYVNSRIIMKTYPSAFQEFSGEKGASTRLSLWAFENFKNFLHSAKSNNSLLNKLNQDKVIFFLHLLGIDTSGHSHKPHSEEYTENIKVADNIVQETEKLINEFYGNDNRSTFLFTSDHGMTDWGSHGEGSVSETEVPYVIWGAGILKPHVNYHQQSPSSWNLNYLQRDDIKQADTVPLMAILLGTTIPVNSVGVLPLSILNFSLGDKSAAILLNARQILAQYIQKQKNVEETTLRYFYKPFELLSSGKEEKIVNLLETHLRKGYYDDVIKGSMDLILLSLLGLAYYHNYYQKLLLFCISTSYIGWICWLLLNVSAREVRQSKKKRFFVLNTIFSISIFVCLTLLTVQSLPYQYYLYCCLPIVIWWNVLKKIIGPGFFINYNFFTCSFLFALFITVVGTELVVVSFFERRALSIVMFLMSFWPIMSGKKKYSRSPLTDVWFISCISLMIFPFLPVIGGKPNNLFLVLCAVLWWCFIFVCNEIFSQIHSTKSFALYSLFYILFGVVLVNVLFVTHNYSLKKGLPYANQTISWIILLLVPTLPLFSSRRLVLRLLNIYFSLGIVSLLFSVTQDALFLPLFSFHLFVWFLMENRLLNDHSHSALMQLSFKNCSKTVKLENQDLRSSDLIRAFLFFFYTVLSFFGTGNIASINSFDVTWVRCFISLFAPFTMMTLILIKIVIPFFATACTFRAINDINKVSVDKIFFIVLMYCDLMALNFLFLVKNIGSWLEIGSSVSHYVISQTIILFLVLLYFISKYLTSLKIKNMEYIIQTLS